MKNQDLKGKTVVFDNYGNEGLIFPIEIDFKRGITCYGNMNTDHEDAPARELVCLNRQIVAVEYKKEFGMEIYREAYKVIKNMLKDGFYHGEMVNSLFENASTGMAPCAFK